MISTDINIKISAPDGIDANDPNNVGKIQIDLSHEDCDDEKLNEFADNFVRLIHYVIDSYQSVVNEELNRRTEPTMPIIETKIRNK